MEDSGGEWTNVTKNWATLVRDGAIILAHNDIDMARTAAAASGGFEVNNTLTGLGFERVLTASDIGASTLGGLSDVFLSLPADGNVFYFNGLFWVNDDRIDLSSANEILMFTNGTGNFGTHYTIADNTITLSDRQNGNNTNFQFNNFSGFIESANATFGIFGTSGTLESRATTIELNNPGGTENFLTADTNGVSLFVSNVETARSIAIANGGFEVDQDYTSGFNPVLTTADVQGVVKASTDSRTSTITPTDDSELAGFLLEPSSSYIIEVVARFDGNGAANNGFRWNFDYNGQVGNVTVTDGSAFSYDTSTATAVLVAPTTAVSQVKNTFVMAGNDEVVEIKIGIITGALFVAGTAVDFQFAQAVSQATATQLGAGSYMRVTKVA